MEAGFLIAEHDARLWLAREGQPFALLPHSAAPRLNASCNAVFSAWPGAIPACDLRQATFQKIRAAS